MKNVLLDILKTDDDYIEIEKIIKSKEKLHIWPFFAIFFLYSSCYFLFIYFMYFTFFWYYIYAFEFIVWLGSTSYATCDGVDLNCNLNHSEKNYNFVVFFLFCFVVVADRFKDVSKQVLIRWDIHITPHQQSTFFAYQMDFRLSFEQF